MALFDASEKTVKKITRDYLDHNEEIEKFISQGGMTKSLLINRVLVATNKRILFIDKNSTQFTEGYKAFDYKNISSITAVKGLMYSKIAFICGVDNIAIQDVDKKEAKAFVDYVNEKRESLPDANSTTIVNQSPDKSIKEQLIELKELLDMELISQDEFDAKKAQLLN